MKVRVLCIVSFSSVHSRLAVRVLCFHVSVNSHVALFLGYSFTREQIMSGFSNCGDSVQQNMKLWAIFEFWEQHMSRFGSLRLSISRSSSFRIGASLFFFRTQHAGEPSRGLIIRLLRFWVQRWIPFTSPIHPYLIQNSVSGFQSGDDSSCS